MLPKRVAVVLGSEGAGISAAMLAAADERIFLPMFGFTESFNLSVSAALVLQKLLEACPESRGDLPEAEAAQIRRAWYAQLAKTEGQRHSRGWSSRSSPSAVARSRCATPAGRNATETSTATTRAERPRGCPSLVEGR